MENKIKQHRILAVQQFKDGESPESRIKKPETGKYHLVRLIRGD